jgi:low affinity Fe/Cu permease
MMVPQNSSRAPDRFRTWFRAFAAGTAQAMGSPAAFAIAVAIVVIWAIAGPYFEFSDSWQLVANTVTTLLTFLMVFLIQATQNRDAKATSVKLDELLRAVEGARTGFADLDALPDEQIEKLQRELQRLGRREGLAPLPRDGAPRNAAEAAEADAAPPSGDSTSLR